MKRFCFAIIGACALLAACTGPKKALDFQVYFKPGMVYKQTSTYRTHQVLTYSGSDNVLETLKAKGIPNPTIKDTVEHRTNIIRTGKMDGDKKFPLVIEVDNAVIPSKYRTPTSSLSVYGSCEKGKLSYIDSVSSSNIPTDVKNIISQSIQSTLAQAILPKKCLNAGDTFTIVQPLNMHIGSSKLDMKIKTTYTLMRLSKDSAWFNTQENYIFNMNVANVPIKATGGGKGTYTYDIANNFYNNYQTTDTFDINYTYPMFTVKMNTEVHGSFSEDISPDK